MIQVIQSDGSPGVSQRLTSTDVAQALSSSILTRVGLACQGFILAVETNPVRIAFGTSPTQGASPVGITLNAGDSVQLMGEDLVSTFRYISASAGVAGVLQILPLY